MRILGDGTMNYCRWSDKTDGAVNIQDVDPKTFFQQHMTGLRQDLLAGQAVPGCHHCKHMENHGKVSGRQRQLLKTGVRLEKFEATMLSSPWFNTWSTDTFDQLPQDWQIDLGNFCNSACVFCGPHSSSRLASEFVSLGMIAQPPTSNWSQDPVRLQRLLDVLTSSPQLRYVHFIGGETLITPAFRTILQALIDNGLHDTVTLGFTTNLISWDQPVVDLLTQFEGVNLGLSIEALHPVNEYLRWPAQMGTVESLLHTWLNLAKHQGWLVQLRTTPTILSLPHLLTVYDFAWQHNVAVESCNFLSRPEFMRPSVLPMSHRVTLIDQWQHWISQHPVDTGTVINSRHPEHSRAAMVQDLQSYVNYLRNEPDESWRLKDLVEFLQRLEHSRGNSIVKYLPEYEELFRTAGL